MKTVHEPTTQNGFAAPPRNGCRPPAAAARLLLVDDHPVFRHGLCQLLAPQDEATVCGQVTNAQDALEAMRRLRPDAVLMEVSMPGTNGIELIKLMRAEQPQLIILVLSMHAEALYALRALRAGARGYVMKQQAMENVLDALRKVLAGGLYVSPQFSERMVFKAIHGSTGDLALPVDKLSDRELEVLQHFGRGKTTRAIADGLHLSVKTIETHRAHIKEKLGFKHAGEMVKFATEWVAATEG